MSEIDLTEKLLEDYNDVFADIVNGLVFNGEQRVKAEDLSESLVHSQYRADDAKLHELERDVVKSWNKSDAKIAICGIENQTNPEKNMVARVFGYEGASYRSQLLVDKNARVVPVITLVLYFGIDRRWKYPKNLKGSLKIPDGLDDYVNDFKINVFEIAWLTDEEIENFTGDFKIVAKFFANRRRNKNYIPDDKQEIEHVDEILKLLSAMTGDNRYEKILALPEKGQVSNMCEVAERLTNIGKAEGIIEGQTELIKATQDAKAGVTYEELVEKYGETTAKNALILK